jgi:hypothetical protein
LGRPGGTDVSLAAKRFALPSLSPRFVPVWRRNLLVWRKLAIASVLGNIADPLLYMLALGYGIGSMIGDVAGMRYIEFIGTGMVCQSAMFTASFACSHPPVMPYPSHSHAPNTTVRTALGVMMPRYSRRSITLKRSMPTASVAVEW